MTEMSPTEGIQRAARLIQAGHAATYTKGMPQEEFRRLVQLEMNEVGDDLENLLYTVAALGGTLAETLHQQTGWDLDRVFEIAREHVAEEDEGGPITA